MRERLKPFQRLLRLMEIDKREIYHVYIYALFNGLVNLSLPLGIQAIINLIQGGEISTSWIVLVAFVILGVLLTGILQLMQLRIVENISQRIFSRASFEFAYRFPRIKYNELYKYYAPELANRFFDTLTIQKGLPKILIDFSLAAFQIIVGLIVLSLYHPFFVIFGVVLIALVYTIIMITGPKGLKTSLQESKYKYNVAHWIEEIARTKLSFKMVDNQEIAMSKTDEAVSGYLNAREGHFKVLVTQFLQLIGFKVLIAAGLLIIGGLLVFEQEMNIGQFVAAEIIIILIINSVEKLIKSLDSIYDVLTALEKIGYVTDMELDKSDGLELDLLPEQLISSSLKDVSFKFIDSKKEILSNINIDIHPGESAVICGPAGSGKSTLIALWSGIIAPSQGVVKYNNLSIDSIDFDSFKKHIGFALSNNDIFLGSLIDNISMKRKGVNLQDVQEAIELVNLTEFVSELSDGLLTELDPEAKRIPRSVSNKIILARAIVNRPKLLMLEDPLDHVPKDEKQKIIEKLTDKDRPWAIIITSVDELWCKYINKVIRLEDGKIVA